MQRESVSRATLIGCLAGIPVGIFYELFLLGPMRGNVILGLIDGIALAPSGAAAAALAAHTYRRFGARRGALPLGLLFGVIVAVAVVATVVYFGSQLRLFDASAPSRILVTLGAATGVLASYTTFRRISQKNRSEE